MIRVKSEIWPLARRLRNLKSRINAIRIGPNREDLRRISRKLNPVAEIQDSFNLSEYNPRAKTKFRGFWKLNESPLFLILLRYQGSESKNTINEFVNLLCKP